MYIDRKKGSGVKTAVIIAIIIAAAVCIFFAVRKNSAPDISEDSIQTIENSIEQAMVQCYVVEGAYPSSLEYLTENYGLRLNLDDYYVTYSAFSANIPPTVVVTPKVIG